MKTDPQSSQIPILTAWDSPALSHGFLGRRGGLSIGPYESLNLAYWVGDDSAHVDENWNLEQWGRDELALKHRAYRFAEMAAAAKVLEEVGDP